MCVFSYNSCGATGKETNLPCRTSWQQKDCESFFPVCIFQKSKERSSMKLKWSNSIRVIYRYYLMYQSSADINKPAYSEANCGFAQLHPPSGQWSRALIKKNTQNNKQHFSFSPFLSLFLLEYLNNSVSANHPQDIQGL